MKNSKLGFVSILLAAISLNSYAGGSLPSKQIEKIAFQNGGVFLYASGWPNPNTCSKVDAVVLQNSDPNYDKAYALILAAYMSGKKISGYSDKCTPLDGQTYNTIRGYKYLLVQ